MMAVSPLPSAPRVVIGILSLHGRPVPVVDLRRRLDLPEREYGPDAHLVVLQTPLRRLAIAADEALGLTEVEEGLVASAASLMAGGGPITGAISVGREMLLIHDVEAFLSEDEHGQIVEALRSS
jgi:purine-binding chemotaxis protein CheW